MAAQSVQNRGAQLSTPQANDSHKNGDDAALLRKRNGERTAAGWDQNPELLQWRANVLLDEMMLGAVDITASDSAHPAPAPTRPMRSANSVEYRKNPDLSEHRPSRAEDDHSISHPTGYANGVHHDEGLPPTVSEHGETLSSLAAPYEVSPQDEWLRPAWHFSEPTSPVSPLSAVNPTPSARAVALQEHTRTQTTPADSVGSNHHAGVRTSTPDLRTTAVGAPPPPRAASPTTPKGVSAKNNPDQWVFAAEQRYQQIASHHQPVSPEPGTGMGVASVVTQGLVDPAAAFLDGFATDEYGYTNGADSTSRPSTARQRLNQAARRSNLLPRMSTLDPRALQQEMVMLQTDIEGALPAGHESRERALHLLQKAYTILQTDATRSAEVDYYLQQVRTIGQRVQETLHWSNLYRSRLTVYLGAWVVLSLLVLSGSYIYYNALLATIARLSGADPGAESLLSYNLLTAVSVFFAGSLGGAVGAFINMRQYAQVKQGFFDRKYSLRGLILPLIGGLVGLILSLFFGLIYYLFHLDPAVNLLLGALPALFAFVFGVMQEFIYGTRS